MKTTILYFSATGNSLSAARALAQHLGETELVAIPRYLENPYCIDSARIGLVFPVHMFGLPVILRRLIAALQVSPDAYLFAVATCGGLACSTLKTARHLLSQKGLSLSSGFALSMVNNCTAVAGAPAPHKQVDKIKKAERRIRLICEAIIRQKRTIYPGIPILNWILGTCLYNSALPKIPEMDRQYSAGSDCNGCGMCVKVCPARNISLENGRPSWHHRCEACYACVQWCPKESIQVGKRTIGRRRYRHPRVRFADIARSEAPIQKSEAPANP